MEGAALSAPSIRVRGNIVPRPGAHVRTIGVLVGTQEKSLNRSTRRSRRIKNYYCRRRRKTTIPLWACPERVEGVSRSSVQRSDACFESSLQRISSRYTRNMNGWSGLPPLIRSIIRDNGIRHNNKFCVRR